MPRDIFDERLRLSDPKKFSWEMAPCAGATVEDIDTKTLTDAITEGIAKGRIPEEAALATTTVDRLRPFNVLLPEDVVTNGAVALFGKEPDRFFSHCKVKLARFEGVIMDVFRDQQVMEGNLFQQFRAIVDFCRKHMFLSGNQDDFDSKKQGLVQRARISCTTFLSCTTFSGGTNYRYMPGSAFAICSYNESLFL